jgi:uncharacterized membrane protein YfcA
MISDVLVGLAAIVAGAIAAISGFGIGSILTPLLSVDAEMKTAVAAVSIPHFVGTGLRFWWLRAAVDRRVFWSFGLMSAFGGLVGALLHLSASELALGTLFGSLLIFAGATELTELPKRVQLGRHAALWGACRQPGRDPICGTARIQRATGSFVATATAAGLELMWPAARLRGDASRRHRSDMVAGAHRNCWRGGTVAGTNRLGWLPEKLFRRLLALLIATLGVYMLAAAIS